MANAYLPFFDLFCHLRGEGFPLTPEEYDLLRQALNRGYGLGGWDSLKRICHRLWVKPSPDFDVQRFDATFDRYVRQQKAIADKTRSQQTSEQRPNIAKPPAPDSISPRQNISPPPKPPPPLQQPDAPTAIKGGTPALTFPERDDWILRPENLPLQLETLPATWKVMQKRQPEEGVVYELDIAATVNKICEAGFFSDVVLRPSSSYRAELLLLVDNAEVMIPFRPGFQPLIDAISDRRVTPVKQYQFTEYPVRYVYDWNRTSQAVAVSTLLTHLHRHRTIVLIISDAGAASRSYRPERIIGTTSFLTRLVPCVRDLLWLNPLPEARWRQTSAQAIAQVLNGRMIPLDEASLRNAMQQQDDRMTLCPLPPSILQAAA